MERGTKWEKPSSKQGERTYPTGSLPVPLWFLAPALDMRSGRPLYAERTPFICRAPARYRISNRESIIEQKNKANNTNEKLSEILEPPQTVYIY